MNTAEGFTAEAVYCELVDMLRQTHHIVNGRDQPTKEITAVSATLHSPSSRLVFARPINPAFAIAEVLWILSGSNDNRFISFWNNRMMRFSELDGHYHGAYGRRLGNVPQLSLDVERELGLLNRRFTPSQLEIAYAQLMKFPESRRAVLQIWDATKDMHIETDLRDLPCNIMAHLLVRDNALEWLQIMRSNDIIWGTPYNLFQWTSIQEIVAGWLGVKVGKFTIVMNSLHCYERHWRELDTLECYPIYNHNARVYNYDRIGGLDYSTWSSVYATVMDYAVRLTKLELEDDVLDILETLVGDKMVTEGYRNWLLVLGAEALRKLGYDERAVAVINMSSEYYRLSWTQWHQHKMEEQEHAR